MCGIVGMIDYSKSGFFLKDRQMFQEMLIANSVRGAHSTGVFGGKINGNVDFAKCTGNPYELIQHKDASRIWNKMTSKYKFMVGHGRHATKGAINASNAHPFRVDGITMVHNGTVTQSSLVNVNAHAVDSLAITHALSKNPAKDVLADINGAYALAWHNAKEDKLHIAHNNLRPLALGVDKKEKRVIFASEYGMLKYIGLRNGFTFDELLYVPVDEIWSFDAFNMEPTIEKIPEKKIYSMPVKHPQVHTPPATQGKIIGITSQTTKAQLKLGETILIELKEVVPINNGVYFQCFGDAYNFPEAEVSFLWHGKEEDLINNKMWKAEITTFSHASKFKEKQGYNFYIYTKDAQPSDLVETYDGTIMTKDEFMEAIGDGCSCCKKSLGLKDAENTFVADNYILCEKCADSFFSEEAA